jgi:hypothetical protein
MGSRTRREKERESARERERGHARGQGNAAAKEHTKRAQRRGGYGYEDSGSCDIKPSSIYTWPGPCLGQSKRTDEVGIERIGQTFFSSRQ